MRKNKLILIVLSLYFLIFSLYGCNKNQTTTTTTKEIEIDQVFDIHTDGQKEYLTNNPKLISKYAKGIEELSKPKPVKLTWELESTEYNIYLSENQDFTVGNLTYKTTEKEIEIYNLKINTTYYWYVTNNDGSIKTNTRAFIIETTAPRNLNIEGLTNARDLGGWKIDDNTYIKQGLIYRTSRFNENETTNLLITQVGINVMINDFSIKTELDLRRTDNNENGGITNSPLGSSVSYISIPMQSSGNIIILNKDILKDVFAVLGNKDNYPIVIHCSIGTDRTGLVCYLINSLLGLDDNSLYQDYLFSCFGEIGKVRVYSTIDKYKMAIETADGETHKERTYNYLLSIGVERTDLDNLISIMIENK